MKKMYVYIFQLSVRISSMLWLIFLLCCLIMYESEWVSEFV